MFLQSPFFLTFSMAMGHCAIIRAHIQVLLVLRDVAYLTQRHCRGGDPAAACSVTHYEMETCGSGIVEIRTRVFFFTKRFLGRLLCFLEMFSKLSCSFYKHLKQIFAFLFRFTGHGSSSYRTCPFRTSNNFSTAQRPPTSFYRGYTPQHKKMKKYF
ncbi:unnamed protein product [Trypanosoma congolense IL3000]|uniref:WGS project CAEQ00000000 data, annotated contig 2259 n=1 Tax=Trypanosoma congolense (strain IL3000) TaxID=1068625 RepID=F9WCR7_TRYCI|nr:unnamed protein product [Trypanosoma congolense IL3000]